MRVDQVWRGLYEQLAGVAGAVEAGERHPHPGQVGGRDRAAGLPRRSGDHVGRCRGDDVGGEPVARQHRDEPTRIRDAIAAERLRLIAEAA